jgi:hypothetical protein
MSILDTILGFFAKQVRKSDVVIPAVTLEKPHTIKDNNQSINNGAVNEKSDASLRSETKPRRKRVKQQ